DARRPPRRSVQSFRGRGAGSCRGATGRSAVSGSCWRCSSSLPRHASSSGALPLALSRDRRRLAVAVLLGLRLGRALVPGGVLLLLVALFRLRRLVAHGSLRSPPRPYSVTGYNACLRQRRTNPPLQIEPSRTESHYRHRVPPHDRPLWRGQNGQ